MSVVNYGEAGSLSIGIKAFKDIAAISVSKVEGIEAAKNDFVSCTYKDNELKFKLNIRVSQNSDVIKVCNRVQNMIHESVLQMTGVDTDSIDINIAGFIS